MEHSPLSPQILDLLFDKSEAELTDAEKASLVAHFGSLEAFRSFSGLGQHSSQHLQESEPEPPADAFFAIMDRIDPPVPVPVPASPSIWGTKIRLIPAAAVALLLIGISWFWGLQRGTANESHSEWMAEVDTLIQEVTVYDTIYLTPDAVESEDLTLAVKSPSKAPKQTRPTPSETTPNRSISRPVSNWNPDVALENTRSDEGSAREENNGALRLAPAGVSDGMWSTPLDFP